MAEIIINSDDQPEDILSKIEDCFKELKIEYELEFEEMSIIIKINKPVIL